MEPGAGLTHLAWTMQKQDFDKLPPASPPDVWFVYRTNPAISFWDTDAVGEAMARFPFTVCFAYTRDETNHMADVLLPDCTDLEGLQLLRIGGTKYVEQFWDHQGFALRDPAAPPQGEAKDFTWIATELARRTGLLQAYNGAINRGAAGVKLSGANFDFSLDTNKAHDIETIWDAVCRAASAEVTDGADTRTGLVPRTWIAREPFPRLQWYLYPKLVESGLRFEQPYQERLFRIGKKLERRLHEQGIGWWDKQLEEYAPLPHWRDLAGLWEGALARHFGVRIGDYPFWLIMARSMHAAAGARMLQTSSMSARVRAALGLDPGAGVGSISGRSRIAATSHQTVSTSMTFTAFGLGHAHVITSESRRVRARLLLEPVAHASNGFTSASSRSSATRIWFYQLEASTLCSSTTVKALTTRKH